MTKTPGRLCSDIQLAVLVIIVSSASVHAQSIVNLGALPGASESFASGLSADGIVVAGSSGGRAFRWTSVSGMQELPLLAPLGMGQTAGGYAVSADGLTIVGHSGYRPVRWTVSGAVIDLGSTGAPGGGSALSVSADGRCIVGYSGSSAFRWTEDAGMQQVLASAQAIAISTNGSVIAGHAYDSSSAFRWFSSSDVRFEVAGAGAQDLSADGSVMVGWIQTELGQRAFRWQTGAGVTVLPSPSGANSCYAQAVNADGSVAVGSCQLSGNGPTLAFVWSDSLGAFSVVDRLTTLGVDLSGWTQLSSATGISADGRIVVGYGTFNGSMRAFLADISDPIPSPPCVAADLTSNGIVDGADLGALLAFWGPRSQVFPQADIDGSGTVDGADLGLLLSFWGACP